MDLEAFVISRGTPSRPNRYTCLSAIRGLNLNFYLSLMIMANDTTGPLLQKLDQLNP